MKNARSMVAVFIFYLVAGVITNPVRRSPDLEARRRSAIDRNLIRFGRSYPAGPTVAEVREAIRRPTRKGSSFLRFGRSQPITLTADDLMSLFRAYEEDYDNPEQKRVPNFLRAVRDPKFIRFGRSIDDDKVTLEDTDMNAFPQRKTRGTDHFIRYGRDSEQLNEMEDTTEERKKRSTGPCHDCQS